MNTIDYYLDIAETVSKKSTCLKKQWGTVIVKNNEIIATGYNGAPRKVEDCTERGVCLRENCNRGTGYESCSAVHSEMNALLSAARKDLIDSTLYLVGTTNKGYVENPDSCKLCKRLIKNAGIKEVVIRESKSKYKVLYPSDWSKMEDFIGGY